MVKHQDGLLAQQAAPDGLNRLQSVKGAVGCVRRLSTGGALPPSSPPWSQPPDNSSPLMDRFAFTTAALEPLAAAKAALPTSDADAATVAVPHSTSSRTSSSLDLVADVQAALPLPVLGPMAKAMASEAKVAASLNGRSKDHLYLPLPVDRLKELGELERVRQVEQRAYDSRCNSLDEASVEGLEYSSSEYEMSVSEEVAEAAPHEVRVTGTHAKARAGALFAEVRAALAAAPPGELINPQLVAEEIRLAHEAKANASAAEAIRAADEVHRMFDLPSTRHLLNNPFSCGRKPVMADDEDEPSRAPLHPFWEELKSPKFFGTD